MEKVKMKIIEKETGMFYDIFDITYDKNGYPQFLIYTDGQWIRRSAKYFTPVIHNEENKIIRRSKDGKHKAVLITSKSILHS